IYLNGYTFYVTVNLHDALQNLKLRQLSKDPKNKFKYPWIDQICINQTNSKEKDVQVKMMTRIYDQSHQTIVWLGN
ncbi:HET-domain-containing protein, partial [Stipitochalara longipes BDJ]